MERILVLAGPRTPDPAIARLSKALTSHGYEPRPGKHFDLVAGGWLQRIFLGIASHEDGLVLRVKVKVFPTAQTARLLDSVIEIARGALGPLRTIPMHGGA